VASAGFLAGLVSQAAKLFAEDGETYNAWGDEDDAQSLVDRQMALERVRAISAPPAPPPEMPVAKTAKDRKAQKLGRALEKAQAQAQAEASSSASSSSTSPYGQAAALWQMLGGALSSPVEVRQTTRIEANCLNARQRLAQRRGKRLEAKPAESMASSLSKRFSDFVPSIFSTQDEDYDDFDEDFNIWGADDTEEAYKRRWEELLQVRAEQRFLMLPRQKRVRTRFMRRSHTRRLDD